MRILAGHTSFKIPPPCRDFPTANQLDDPSQKRLAAATFLATHHTRLDIPAGRRRPSGRLAPPIYLPLALHQPLLCPLLAFRRSTRGPGPRSRGGHHHFPRPAETARPLLRTVAAALPDPRCFSPKSTPGPLFGPRRSKISARSGTIGVYPAMPPGAVRPAAFRIEERGGHPFHSTAVYLELLLQLLAPDSPRRRRVFRLVLHSRFEAGGGDKAGQRGFSR